MWLQFEVVRGPVGVVWGRIEPDWVPKGPHIDPNRSQTTPTGPRTTSNCSHMSCSHIHRSPRSLQYPHGLSGQSQGSRHPFDIDRRLAGVLLLRTGLPFSLGDRWVFGRFRPGSGGKPMFYFLFGLLHSWARIPSGHARSCQSQGPRPPLDIDRRLVGVLFFRTGLSVSLGDH
jgi:hypothetical protein